MFSGSKRLRVERELDREAVSGCRLDSRFISHPRDPGWMFTARARSYKPDEPDGEKEQAPYLLPVMQTTACLLALGLLVTTTVLASACGNACRGDQGCNTGVCVLLALEGEPCINGICDEGLWCAPPSFRCARRSTAGPTCDPATANDACGEGHCDPVTRRCLALPVAGEDCTIDGRCAEGVFCRDGVCAGPPGVGEPCERFTGFPCAPGLTCDGALCQRPERAECP